MNAQRNALRLIAGLLSGGDAVLEQCKVACTACGKCVMDAAPGLISIVSGVAVVNYALNELEPDVRLYVESMLAVSEEHRNDIYEMKKDPAKKAEVAISVHPAYRNKGIFYEGVVNDERVYDTLLNGELANQFNAQVLSPARFGLPLFE